MGDDTLRCKDCVAEQVATIRPAPFPGPRCTTHHRRVLKARSRVAHDRRVARTYGLKPGGYELLYVAQGGRCAAEGCRATGKAKRLAVDHDHSCCPGPVSCGRCVRGLLCSTHNQQVGQNRDNPVTFASLAEYLRNPPARRVLGEEAA